MIRKAFQNSIIILLLLAALPLWCQSDEEDELIGPEEQARLEKEFNDTGIELYYHYPIPVFMPGWSYSSKDMDIGPFDIPMLGTNFSLITVCLGMDVDLGSHKPVLKNMGFGFALEWNILDSWNMEGNNAALFQSYTYLFYREETKKYADYYLKAGMGIAEISNEELLEDYDNNTSGALFLLEAASAYPAFGRFRLYSGLTYKYIIIYDKEIHSLGPFFRVAYRF